jgi:hypothetical protein
MNAIILFLILLPFFIKYYLIRIEKKILPVFKNCMFLLFSGQIICNAQNMIQQVDSIQISGAAMWGGISFDGQYINITTMMGEQIHWVKYDTNLNQISTPLQLTGKADHIGNMIADHKHVYLNDTMFITFSCGNELYVLKLDSSGNRIKLVCIEDTSNKDYFTNDMHFFTDSNYLYLLYPKVGGSMQPKLVRKLNFNLDTLAYFYLSTNEAVSELGNTYFKDSTFYYFAGSSDHHNLIVNRWSESWIQQSPFSDTIVYQADSNEFNYFSTGLQFDHINQLWFIAYHHLSSDHKIGDESDILHLAVTDNSFNILEDITLTETGYYRPHLLYLNNHLYCVYDGSEIKVYLKKFKLNTSNAGFKEIGFQKKNLALFPNPSYDYIYINIAGESESKYILNIINLYGQKIGEYIVFENKLNISHLLKGVYFIGNNLHGYAIFSKN